MGIKSVLNNKQDSITYPCLMVDGDSNSIYLIFGEDGKGGKGVSLNNSVQIDNNWDMDNMRPYTGSITLSND